MLGGASLVGPASIVVSLVGSGTCHQEINFFIIVIKKKKKDFATYLYKKSVFQLYASTTLAEGALCALEAVFGPS